jgi:hypothetical protein
MEQPKQKSCEYFNQLFSREIQKSTCDDFSVQYSLISNQNLVPGNNSQKAITYR